jgi:hypothetical protein
MDIPLDLLYRSAILKNRDFYQMAKNPSLSDRFLGCLLGGTLGDALGTPIEINRDFADLHRKYGDTGLDRMVPYILSWGDTQSNGIGAITDDTTMLADTLEAINLTLAENGNGERLLYLSHQAYLRWGELQQGGEALKAHPHFRPEQRLRRHDAGRSAGLPRHRRQQYLTPPHEMQPSPMAHQMPTSPLPVSR